MFVFAFVSTLIHCVCRWCFFFIYALVGKKLVQINSIYFQDSSVLYHWLGIAIDIFFYEGSAVRMYSICLTFISIVWFYCFDYGRDFFHNKWRLIVNKITDLFIKLIKQMNQSKFEFKILPGITINTEKFLLIFINFLSHNNFLKNEQFLTTQKWFVNQLSAASFEKYFLFVLRFDVAAEVYKVCVLQTILNESCLKRPTLMDRWTPKQCDNEIRQIMSFG